MYRDKCVASLGTVLLVVAPILTGIHLLILALILDIEEERKR